MEVLIPTRNSAVNSGQNRHAMASMRTHSSNIASQASSPQLPPQGMKMETDSSAVSSSCSPSPMEAMEASGMTETLNSPPCPKESVRRRLFDEFGSTNSGSDTFSPTACSAPKGPQIEPGGSTNIKSIEAAEAFGDDDGYITTYNETILNYA